VEEVGTGNSILFDFLLERCTVSLFFLSVLINFLYMEIIEDE